LEYSHEFVCHHYNINTISTIISAVFYAASGQQKGIWPDLSLQIPKFTYEKLILTGAMVGKQTSPSKKTFVSNTRKLSSIEDRGQMEGWVGVRNYGVENWG